MCLKTRYMEINNAIRGIQSDGTRATICDNCTYCGNNAKGNKLICVKTAYKKPKYYYTPKSDMPKDRYVNWNGICDDFDWNST
ncbi:hypothetical protein FACS1894217_13800 [Clostridia bacterium]|nr:hypothetical protein FACS1894217_13800 [Clostridia bacterium]